MNREMTAGEAFSRLSALCARSEHCQSDMLGKMRLWGLSDEEQAQVMSRLTAGRYVDDERYARAFARDKARYGKWGRRKIEQALRMKRIDDSIVEDALSDISDDDYIAVLQPLVKQKMRTTRADSDYELRQKVTRFAISRGYTMDVIRRCIDTADIADADYDE